MTRSQQNQIELAAYRAIHPTPSELEAVLGSNWAICRKTPRNVARYARCLTPKEFRAAQAQAIAARA